jgi:peptide/nickel transport system permease protein
MTAVAAPADIRERVRVRRPALPIGLAVAWMFLVLLLLAMLWPGLFAAHAPDAADPAHALAGVSTGHPFGTDQLGRDVFARVIYGARISPLLGLGATAIAVTAGALLGVLAATAGRAVDELVMRAADVLLAFPGLLLALLIVGMLGPGTVNTMLAIGCAAVPGFVRLTRSQALVVRRSDYVRAAVMLGRGRAAILFRHILPNAVPPLLVLATVDVGTAILAAASLSFLGLGPPAPAPEWGAMLAGSRDYLAVAWPAAVFPGLAVTLTVLAINAVGRDLRRRFEGRRAA